MYRIEIAPGEETVFRTIEELAVSIRNGVVTHRARIFHHASQKWLPIALHPHYKKALEMPAASPPHAPVTATTPVPGSSRSKGHSASHPHPHSEIHYPEPKPASEAKPAPITALEPGIKPPVQSPVISMQNEVLRDLPVISLPEPLPWMKRSATVAPTTPAPEPAVYLAPAVAPPTPEPVVQAPVPPAPIALEPIAPAPVTPAPVVHPPVAQAPVVHAPVVHAPVVHAPPPRAPVVHAPPRHAPVVHAPAPYAPARHAPARHAPARHAAVSHAPAELAWPADRRDADQEELPVRPTARRSRRMNGRPLLLLGTAAALVVGTHLALTATPAASTDPSEPAPVARSEEPARRSDQPPSSRPTGTRSASTRSSEPPRVTTAPARVSTAPARVPMTPGPAFAGSVPARPGLGADTAGIPKAVIQAPAPGPDPAPPAIAPAPAAVELSLPGLPDSVVPTARTGDTMAMKKILRALNGPSAARSTRP